jgi:transaldolase
MRARSFVQATAAAQAGISVIQPNIGRLDDWYHKHPGVIRDPKVKFLCTRLGHEPCIPPPCMQHSFSSSACTCGCLGATRVSYEASTDVRQGPREDTGFLSDVNPGVSMAARIYSYCAKYHPKTKVMVSGIRKATGAALCLFVCGLFQDWLGSRPARRCLFYAWPPETDRGAGWTLVHM